MRNRSIVSEQRAPYGRRGARTGVPPLIHGQRLGADEFMRRYEAMPELKKAELIQGVVYLMTSPVSAAKHGTPDNLMQGPMFLYAAETPGVEVHGNSTIRLGPDDVPQPDVMMRLMPAFGGGSRINDQGYVEGAPEMAVEIVASTAALDLKDKLETYRKFGVKEYLAWRTPEKLLYWFYLENGDYRQLQPDKDCIFRSRVFPGFWIGLEALLAGDRAAVIRVLKRGLKSGEHRAFCRK